MFENKAILLMNSQVLADFGISLTAAIYFREKYASSQNIMTPKSVDTFNGKKSLAHSI
jgi:hypothetical protein